MNIPNEVIEAAAKAQYEWQDGLPSWENDADGFTKAEYISQTEAAVALIAEWARESALREAEDAVIDLFPPNCELNPDGTEDAITAAWVEGGHDSWEAIHALRSATDG